MSKLVVNNKIRKPMLQALLLSGSACGNDDEVSQAGPKPAAAR